MRITWLGHSGVLIEAGGVRVVTDPLLRSRFAGLRWAVPLPAAVRSLARGELTVDAVLISHLHHDHCDVPSLRTLGAPTVVVPVGAGAWLRRVRVGGVVEAAVGERVDLGAGLRVTKVHAEHNGRREPRGPRAMAVGHLVETADLAVWLAGDTGLHPSFRDLPQWTHNGRVDVAVVPVWGWGPSLGPGHLDPMAAAQAVLLSGAAHAIAVHWGTLYPVGLRSLMKSRLAMPGRQFADHLTGTGVTAYALPVGGRFTVPST